MRLPAMLVLLLMASAPASAATWRVEKDGSGHFTVIQDAVDAAAPGDTIRIGPGRFSEQTLWGNPPWARYTCVNVAIDDLTIIGAGAKVTVIGSPTPLFPEQYQDSGISAHDGLGARTLRVRDLGLENVYWGLELWYLTRVQVDDCRFAGCDGSVGSHAVAELEIADCDFASLTRVFGSGDHLIAWGPGKAAIDRCRFEASRVHDGNLGHVHAEVMTDLHIADCEFVGGKTGVSATGGGTIEIRGCVFDGQFLFGISNEASWGVMRISDTRLRDQYTALRSWAPAPTWEVDRIVVEDARVCSFSYLYAQAGHIRGSQLAKGWRYVVEGYDPQQDQPVSRFDMRDNWWGTADADSIAAWIEDGEDFVAGDFFIDWLPFRGGPVAAQRRSLGGVKAIFR